MKLFDYVALFTAVSLTVLSFISALVVQSDSQEILIQAGDQEWIYPLESVVEQSFSGPVGNTVVTIGNGMVNIIESDCKEQICVQSGHIHSQGQWIACLPNRIFVTIRGKKEGELDAEVY